MLDNTKTKMFLYNYYVENGSFSNLSEKAPSLYRSILNEKKEKELSDLSVSEYIEGELLPYRPSRELDSSYIRALYEHYSTHGSLTGTKVDKSLEGRLRRTATKLKLSLTELKEKLDRQDIYPEVMNRIINRYDVRDYNTLLSNISISLALEMQYKPNLKMDLFRDFNNFVHLKYYETLYATFLQSRIPQYGGPITSSDDIGIIMEGNRYYGTDLKLDTIPSLMDDLLFALKGFTPRKNLTPSVFYKLSKMMQESGNLNRIGLDGWKLIYELDELSMNLGYSTIKDLLVSEGYEFNPIDNEDVSIVPCGHNYEVIIRSYDKAQVIIDEQLKRSFESMDLVQTLQVQEGPYQGQTIALLTYKYEEKYRIAYELITKTVKPNFNDGNTLNLVAENLIPKVV